MPNFFDKTLPFLTPSFRVKLFLLFALGQVLALEHGDGINFMNLILGWIVVFFGYASMTFLDQYLHSRTNQIINNIDLATVSNPKNENRHLLLGCSAIVLSSISLAIHLYLNSFQLTLPLFIMGWILFMIYSVPPFKIKFRGGGETYSAVGMTLFIPIFSACLQSGNWVWDKSLTILIPLLFLVMASRTASSLIHEKTYKYIGRSTLVSTIGNPSARLIIEYYFLFSVCLIGIFQYFTPNPLPLYFAIGNIGILLSFFYLKIKPISASAILGNSNQINSYSNYLDYGLLSTLLITTGGVVFNYWVGP